MLVMRAVGEIEGREGIRRGMRGNVYRMIEDQPELRNGAGPRDRERVVLVVIGESETEFVQQRRGDRIVVGNHQAAILFVGSVIGQKIVRGCNNAGVVVLGVEGVLEAVANIELLFGVEVVIES